MKAMISFSQLAMLLLAGVFLASCAPYPPGGPYGQRPPNAEAVDPANVHSSEIERQKEANRKRLAAERRANEARAGQDGSGNTTPPPAPPRKSKYPTAKKTDRKGIVINPYTGNEVDVRGIPGGQLVVDPDDPNQKTNKFRVP